MEYTEYMETLKEQIQNKRARSLVAEEIRGHIEEQAKEYQAEGMSKEDAEREAVRQMGDPVETGCALNRIHRPAFPWKLFVLAVFLTGASMLISLTIDAKINEGGVQAAQVGSLFMVNAVSFAMIFVIMYFDYTWLFLHIRAVYALYMICLCLVWSGGILGNYQTQLLPAEIHIGLLRDRNQMDMRMGHFQAHDSQPYTLTLDSGLLGTSYPFSESYHPSQHRIIDIKDIIDLLLGNYQGMPQGYRIDIEESKKLIVFRNLVARDLTRHDSTENSCHTSFCF